MLTCPIRSGESSFLVRRRGDRFERDPDSSSVHDMTAQIRDNSKASTQHNFLSYPTQLLQESFTCFETNILQFCLLGNLDVVCKRDPNIPGEIYLDEKTSLQISTHKNQYRFVTKNQTFQTTDTTLQSSHYSSKDEDIVNALIRSESDMEHDESTSQEARDGKEHEVSFIRSISSISMPSFSGRTLAASSKDSFLSLGDDQLGDFDFSDIQDLTKDLVENGNNSNSRSLSKDSLLSFDVTEVSRKSDPLLDILSFDSSSDEDNKLPSQLSELCEDSVQSSQQKANFDDSLLN